MPTQILEATVRVFDYHGVILQTEVRHLDPVGMVIDGATGL